MAKRRKAKFREVCERCFEAADRLVLCSWFHDLPTGGVVIHRAELCERCIGELEQRDTVLLKR